MSKHDTVKTITENNILQKQKIEHFSRDKTSGSQAKKKKKNLTINKTCVCDPHSLNISFKPIGDEGRGEKMNRDYKIWTQSRQLTFYKLSVNIYEPTLPSSFSEIHQPLLMRPHAFS